MKIAIVGPGLVEIPPRAWGGVEVIICNLQQQLEARGHSVILFNRTDIERVIEELNNSDFDFIHLNYDLYAPHFMNGCAKPYCISTHYGYFMQREKWPEKIPDYNDIHAAVLRAPAIFCYPMAHATYKTEYAGFLRCLRQGVDISAFRRQRVANNASSQVICLARISERKRQSELDALLRFSGIDFVGPCNEQCKISYGTYLGEWPREKICEELTTYRVLALPSKGEMSPLVIPEALAAGVSVVACGSSLCPIMRAAPGIYEARDDLSDFGEVLIRAMNENSALRPRIVSYAGRFHSWEVVSAEYERFIKDFINAAN